MVRWAEWSRLPPYRFRLRGHLWVWSPCCSGCCLASVAGLLAHDQLHVRNERVGSTFRLPGGRRFIVFRDTSRDGPPALEPVTLAVWFHLWAVPPRAKVRRFLFERLSIINTLLFAGFDGYLVKLWMVDPLTSDYAGLYTWRDAESAAVYGRYITSVIRLFSAAGSVGFEIAPNIALAELVVKPADKQPSPSYAARSTAVRVS